MKRMDVSVVLLALLTTVSLVSLVLVGETRPDAYLSMTILVYFVYTTVDPVVRARASLRVIDVLLFLVFAFVVAMRVLEILGMT